jgi:hypothetical protein
LFVVGFCYYLFLWFGFGFVPIILALVPFPLFPFFFLLVCKLQDGVGAGDVMQGELGDCWFLGAMSVVATRNDLMYPLFIAAHPEIGFYQVTRDQADGQIRQTHTERYMGK